MSAFKGSWMSLRMKITALAVVPAVVCSIVFGLMIWFTSGHTAAIVSDDMTKFMTERTSRATTHGYNTSIVTYGYVLDTLRANAETTRLLLAKEGGVHPVVGHTESWQAVNDETHEATPVTVPSVAIGGWQSSQRAGAGPLRDISQVIGHAVILFERIDAAGDMMRVAGATPEAGATMNPGSYLPARLGNGDANRVVATILSGARYEGRSDEMGGEATVVCEPLREGGGNVFGMVCVAMSNAGIHSLRDELEGNFVGPNGSVAVFYGHGRERGKLLVAPKGIAKATQELWFPVILEKSQRTKDKETDGTVVRDPATGANIVVRYSYFEPFDWMIAVIADSRDLANAGDAVSVEFHKLILRTFLVAALFVLLTIFVALSMSKRVIDPMVDLTIRLTSNATQIASSARQQQSNVASFNTSGNEIASAVKEISATSKELLRSMEQLAEDAEKTSEVANEGSQGLRGLGSSMGSLSTATHSIADKLAAIRQKANKINAVVTVITKVADQTNLLSLNAAIEAEKAGEGGAGFAVVAREIRRLADQSAIATMEIEQMVEAMQEAVSSGVAQTRELTDAMERGITASESISGQFGDIIARVESMAPRYEAVHQGMQNQSEGAHQISEAMWQLTEMGRQTSDSVNDLNQVSQQLHGAVRILKERIIQVRGAE